MTNIQTTEQPVSPVVDISPVGKTDLLLGGMQMTGMFLTVLVLREIRMLVKECKS
jgi:hypothetical protein